MNNGLEGIPGSGKSYEAVIYHALDAIKRGRRVVTNLPLNLGAFLSIDPGYADLIEIRSTPQSVFGVWDALASGTTRPLFKLFRDMPETEWPEGVVPLPTDSAEGIVYLPGLPPRADLSVFSSVWDYYSLWKGKDGNGPLFIIDECHVPLPKVGTDVQVVQWFKQHRHFNVDVLLMTPNFRDVCPSVTGLMGVVVKVRKADILGRKGSYIRKVHAGYRGAVISQEEREYKPQFFALYQSHTQGNSVAENAVSDVSPFSAKFAKFSKLFWVLTVPVVVYAFWPKADAKAEEVNSLEMAHKASGVQALLDKQAGRDLAPVKVAAQSASAAASAAPSVAVVDPSDDPFGGKTIHVTGRIRTPSRDLLTVVLASGGQRVLNLTSDDLRQAGYGVRIVADCVAELTWQGKVRPIICDAPTLASGANDRPVIMAQAYPVGTTPPPPRREP